MNNSFGGSKKGEEVVTNEPLFSPTQVEARYRKWFPDLSSEVIAKLIAYQSDLVKFNKVLNLVPLNTLKTAEQTHIADAVLASRLIYPNLVPKAPLYDFSGANGIPGLVFATLYPNIQVIIVDRDGRKVEFAKQVAAAMKLSNVSLELKGADELPNGSVVNVVARGISPLQRALLAFRKQVGKGGRLFHMKGDGWANELASVPSQLFSYWSPSLLGQYKLPETQTSMAVVLTDKTAE